MLSLKSFHTAAVTLSGIELAHRIRKRQFCLDLGAERRSAENPSMKELWDQALTAGPVPAACVSHLPPSMHQNSKTRRDPVPQIRSDAPRRYPRKVFSGGGLYLYHTPGGGKYWRYKYRYGGKEKTLSLGAYPDVPSESARARHRLARQLLAAGVDPSLRREQLRCCSTVESTAFDRAREWRE